MRTRNNADSVWQGSGAMLAPCDLIIVIDGGSFTWPRCTRTGRGTDANAMLPNDGASEASDAERSAKRHNVC